MEKEEGWRIHDPDCQWIEAGGKSASPSSDLPRGARTHVYKHTDSCSGAPAAPWHWDALLGG